MKWTELMLYKQQLTLTADQRNPQKGVKAQRMLVLKLVESIYHRRFDIWQ